MANGTRPEGPRTLRFWDGRRTRIAFRVCVVVSVVLHGVMSPWDLLPHASLDVKDMAGELSIPVDLLGEEAPTPPPPTPPPPEPPAPPPLSTGGPGSDGHRGPHDAGRPRDGGPADAGRKPRPDAGRRDAGEGPMDRDASDQDLALTDGGAGEADGAAAAVAMASEGGASDGDGGALAIGGGDGGLESGALASAGPDGGGAGGARDPASILGEASGAQAGKQNILLVVDMRQVRRHPVGASLGPLLVALPQWTEFLQGSGIDPVAQTDWISLNGPSLARTERDVVMVHYATEDAVIEKVVASLAKRVEGGGPIDAGTGVPAYAGYGDRAKRVFLFPQPHLLVVTPPDYAPTAARALRKARVGIHLRPQEIAYFKAFQPHGSVAQVPEAIQELRLSLFHGANRSVEIRGEADCPDGASAEGAARELKDFLQRANSLGVRIVTRGILDHVEVRAEGTRVVLFAPVTLEQIEALFATAAGYLGLPPPSASGVGPSPGPPPTPAPGALPAGSAPPRPSPSPAAPR